VVPFSAGITTATSRALAGPGHVIYSAFAGYYLGLAKFNPEDAGPIVVKGLVVASLVHATYNALVSNLGALSGLVGLGWLSTGALFVGFVILYDGAFAYVLYRKLEAYREAYFAVGADRLDGPVEGVERDEFEWDRSDAL
jgi:RsiW-degrading membrane proteinase PrsW (M82 family)